MHGCKARCSPNYMNIGVCEAIVEPLALPHHQSKSAVGNTRSAMQVKLCGGCQSRPCMVAILQRARLQQLRIHIATLLFVYSLILVVDATLQRSQRRCRPPGLGSREPTDEPPWYSAGPASARVSVNVINDCEQFADGGFHTDNSMAAKAVHLFCYGIRARLSA